MSRATASSAPPPNTPPRKALPAWTRRKNPWGAIPEVFWTHVAAEVCPAALVVCGYLVFAAGEAEFTGIQQAELAKKLKMHVNTVQACLDELERAGAIAVRKVGKRNIYDLLVDDWRKVKCRPRPKVEEIAAEEAEDAADETTAAPRKPLTSLRLKRGEARAINLPPAVTLRTVRCENRSSFPLEIEAKIGEDSLLQLEISEKAAIDNENAANKRVKSPIPNETAGYPALRDMLNLQLGGSLGFVPEDDLLAIGTALNGCPIDHLARRILQRRAMFSGGKGTWGGVLLLAQDCAKAFAAASLPTNPPVPPIAPANGPTAEDEAAYETHCGQLFNAWWRDQDEDTRSRLAAQHKREIVARFNAAKFWPPAQLADTVQQSIRAEALKTIAPTFEDFLRGRQAKAKGVGA